MVFTLYDRSYNSIAKYIKQALVCLLFLRQTVMMVFAAAVGYSMDIMLRSGNWVADHWPEEFVDFYKIGISPPPHWPSFLAQPHGKY